MEERYEGSIFCNKRFRWLIEWMGEKVLRAYIAYICNLVPNIN